MNAYIGLLQVLAVADQDPTQFSAADIARYAEPEAAADFASSFQQMVQKGLAYRGQPDDPRLTVVGPDSMTSIILTSCPQADVSDPSVQYFVKTGQTVSPTTPASPVYQRFIRMVKTDGVWKLEQIRSDTSKVCPA